MKRLYTEVVDWIEKLQVPSGMLAGKQFKMWPWQREIIQKLYCNNRAVRQAVISIPGKNGKTGLAAGLALAHRVAR